MSAINDQVPVIDIDRLQDRGTLARLDEACRSWGFLQVSGHGIPQELLDATHAQMRELFALPAGEKRAIERTAANAWGYYDQELTKNVRDWKEIYDVGPAVSAGPLVGTIPQWPASLPRFQPSIRAYYAACEQLAYRLLGAIAMNLGVPAERLFQAFGPRHTSFLRLNHYPLCGNPAGADSPTIPTSGHLGVHHHTDAGALTLLLQDDQPGLQVYRGNAWYLVEPRPDALVVNIGDIVQVWSNDRYQAALHRVLASGEAERYSAPFFFNPACAATYAPLPSVCGNGNPPRYRPINWGEFRAARATGDYADHGVEIQISHFRVATS